MSSSSYSSSSACYEPWKQDTAEQRAIASGAGSAGVVIWMPVLVPYWEYPQTLATGLQYAPQNHLVDVEDQGPDDQPLRGTCLPHAFCQENSDSYSDASTDVGDDEDGVYELEDEAEKPSPVVSTESLQVGASRTPCFLTKPSRQQRVEQLRRVVGEFCALSFDAVDASSQEALVLRMLTILKSLGESAIVYEDQCRYQEKRLALLDLSEHDDAINEVIGRADDLCQQRSYRAAFHALQQLAPCLSKGMGLKPEAKDVADAMPVELMAEMNDSSATGMDVADSLAVQMSPAEIEAMKKRRLEKRKRQREERRGQRATQRSERSAQRYKPPCKYSSSSSSPAPAHSIRADRSRTEAKQ